jgi:hypothetical protein
MARSNHPPVNLPARPLAPSCAATVNFALDGLDANGAPFQTASQVRHAASLLGTPCSRPRPPTVPRSTPGTFFVVRLPLDSQHSSLITHPIPPRPQVRKLNSYSLVALFAKGKSLFFDFVSAATWGLWQEAGHAAVPPSYERCAPAEPHPAWGATLPQSALPPAPRKLSTPPCPSAAQKDKYDNTMTDYWGKFQVAQQDVVDAYSGNAEAGRVTGG